MYNIDSQNLGWGEKLSQIKKNVGLISFRAIYIVYVLSFIVQKFLRLLLYHSIVSTGLTIKNNAKLNPFTVEGGDQ